MIRRPISDTWRYTLELNKWLNLPKRRHGTFVWREPDPKGVNIVYDFAIWKGVERIASWAGTESEAFNALLHFAEHEEHIERRAAMRAVLDAECSQPVTWLTGTVMEDQASCRTDNRPAKPATKWPRLVEAGRAEMRRQQGSRERGMNVCNGWKADSRQRRRQRA